MFSVIFSVRKPISINTNEMGILYQFKFNLPNMGENLNNLLLFLTFQNVKIRGKLFLFAIKIDDWERGRKHTI